MVVDVPAEIIPPEILRIFRAAADDVVERVQPELLRLAQLPPQLIVLHTPPQRPHCIHERQSRHLEPRRAQIKNLMLTRRAEAGRRRMRHHKIQRRIADQHHKILPRRRRIALQRLELRLQPPLRQQHLKQPHACERRRIAEHLPHLLDWPAVSHKHTPHLAQRRHRHAIKNIVTVVQQRLDHAHQRGIQLIAAQHLGQLRGRGKNNLILQPARKRHGVERPDRPHAERCERLPQARLALMVQRPLVALDALGKLLRRFRRGHAKSESVV